ncbi:cytochrome o ubiquinol oxidase subunit III [Pandoraea terrae]|uniref:Cytochrome o ubiquinol oxidase subunit III n=1 Tax=Pandoraea terrae TaxID=1537710 RepID=A0A5E4ZCB4_9BURK|nr:cytochrome c oxidase subunit 3 [Pandoraea terrae]VVE57930.1 cytochrome o ubiquinol oxidase subunit III [Pandoraea terrae]
MQKDARRLNAAPSARMPGTEGIWTFVFIDMCIFLLIFLTFMSERLRYLALYTASQRQLNEWFGLANTLILLTSSWTIMKAVQSARQAVPKRASQYLALTLFLGFAFAVNKLREYASELGAGVTPATNPFFSFYFFITVAHFLHVLAGMLFMGVCWHQMRTHSRTTRFLSTLENVGLFWHYVDVLWIFIFPSLYLLGRFS